MVPTVRDGDFAAIWGCFSNEGDREAVKELLERVRSDSSGRKVQRGEFKVPVLAVRYEDQLDLFDESHFLSYPWNLAECAPVLSEAEFPTLKWTGSAGELDVDERGRVEVHFVDQLQDQLYLLSVESGWSIASLANWIDRRVPHPDIPQAHSTLFIYNVLAELIKTRGTSIHKLARQKFRLRKAVEARIDTLRKAHLREAYQEVLFGEKRIEIEVGPDLCLNFLDERYSPNWSYDGAFRFSKHYFSRVGELKSEGEEFECAVFIDGLRQVKYWARNLERRRDSSFWLHTATDRFYPDFVALLEDGRVLVVEYKGEHLWSNEDSVEKRAVGELWSERSSGRCLFVMPRGKDWSAIESTIESVRGPGTAP